jgi:DNA topoisomerase-2
MRLKKFFDEEMKLFSIYDNVRSIPDAIDGCKPSQRKVLFGMLKRGENAPELKVETAANQIAAVSDYHHGAAGLIGTIAKMAQTFAGSNNINLLMPNGQFGSRLDPSNGAGRYIFTELSKNFRFLFKKEDDAILKHQLSDGMQIEPERYFPILPMLLINGASGTGTGYACEIFSYNPEDIRQNILAILNGKKPKEIFPWYRGFKGKINRNDRQTVIEGCYELVNTTTIRITELPIGTYQDDYKAHLNDLKDAEVIKGFSDSSTEDGFDFEITIPRTTGYMDHDTIMKTFKLIGRDTENYTCWGHDGKIKVFENTQQIIDYFVEFRLQKYEERRLKQIENLIKDLAWANEKLRFIKFYIKNPGDFSKKNKADLNELLTKNKFVEIDKLLQIRIYSLTKEEIEKLEKEIDSLNASIIALKNTTNLELYIKELKELKL